MKKIVIMLIISMSAFGQVKVATKEGKLVEVNSPATNSKQGQIKLAGDLGGTADAPIVIGLSDKAPLFSPALTGVPIAPTPIAGDNTVKIATTEFVTTAIGNISINDATTTTKGVVKLAGDLGGTAASPTVPALATKEPSITAGTTSQYWRGDKTWQTLDLPTIKEHTYNRYIATDGNDISGKGTDANPYLTISKAVAGAQFPFSLHLEGQTFAENITLASGQSNFNLITDNSMRGRNTTILSGTITTQSGFTRLGVKGLTINSGASIPLTFGAGDTGRHSFENVSFETTNSSIASFNSNFTNWINFFNCDFSGSPTSTLVLPNLIGSATISLFDCSGVNISVGSGWTVYTNGSTVLNHINLPSATSLIVDLKTVRTAGVITSQSGLTTLLGTTSGADGAYVINFVSPTGINGLSKGDIILKVGPAQGIIYKFSDAPASIIQTNGLTHTTWIKSGSNWSVATPSDSPILTGIPTAPTATAGTNTTQLATTAFVTTAVASISSNSNSIINKTSDYTLTLNDSTILCDASIAGFTITLPTASSAVNKMYSISKIDNTYNLISFSPAIRVTSSETISSMNFGATIKVISDGTNWKLIN